MSRLRYGEVYAYTTRKPWARGVLGTIPVLGRHLAYVGKTRDGRRRHAQHMGTDMGPYAKVAQPWSNLDPHRYVLWSMRRCPDWLLSAMEVLLIRLLLPVYNVQHNRGNPRRIKPWEAKAQRAARDAGRTFVRPTAALRWLGTLLVAGALLAYLAS